MFWYPTCRIKQIIFSVALMQPRTFGIDIFIFLSFYPFFRIRSTKTFNSLFYFTDFTLYGDHVIIQLCVVNIRISPIKISLSIIINPNSRIYVIPTAITKRFPNCIFKRTSRTITNSHPNSHRIGQLGMKANIPIELSITFYTLRSPSPIICPFKRFNRKRGSVVSPIHHIGSRINPPFLHPEKVGTIFIMSGINIKSTIMYHRSRIGRIARLYYRVLCCKRTQDCRTRTSNSRK